MYFLCLFRHAVPINVGLKKKIERKSELAISLQPCFGKLSETVISITTEAIESISQQKGSLQADTLTY